MRIAGVLFVVLVVQLELGCTVSPTGYSGRDCQHLDLTTLEDQTVRRWCQRHAS